MKKHEVLDLTAPETDKLITPEDVMKIPEFLAGYERSNNGGVTKGLPVPKYKESDQQSNPAKYEKLRQEYLAATRKFIETNPAPPRSEVLERLARGEITAGEANRELEAQ